MRTRTSGLALLLWGMALVSSAYGQEPSPTDAHLPATLDDTAVLVAAPAPQSPPPVTSDWIGVPESLLAPQAYLARGQDYAPPDPPIPLPTYSTRPSDGGLFLGLGFVYMQQTMPIQNQAIAFRGIVDADGSIAARLNLPPVPGTVIGSRSPGLNTNDLGQSQYSPGFDMFAGWRFRNGVTVEVDWLHLNKVKYVGGASIEPQNFNGGSNLADTFLTAPVFNFPNEFAGPATKIGLGNPGALFGIWDGASVMTIQFTQRFDQYDISGRIPVYQDDNNRCYGIVAFRNAYMVDKFKWVTTSIDTNGAKDNTDVANYYNNTTNNMFGPVVGCGDEWRCGDSPLGTFSVSLDLRAGLLVDIAKEYTKYELGDLSISSKQTRRLATICPEVQATPSLCWYPIEGVQVKVGYDAFAFFNTFASPSPVVFNYLQLDAAVTHQIRFFNGMNAAIAFIF